MENRKYTRRSTWVEIRCNICAKHYIVAKLNPFCLAEKNQQQQYYVIEFVH